MCRAFSCLVLPGGEVLWEFGVDSHEALIKKHSLVDNTCDPAEMTFCRVEYAPRNGSYLKPDGWELRVDQGRPAWWSARHAKAVKAAWKTWKAKLDRRLVYKRIVKPFEDKKPPKKITKKHLDLLRQWASVWASVRASVGASVRDSVRAYIGSFFRLPRKAWKRTSRITRPDYPYQSAVDLWEMGLVPTYNGNVWRLHGGPDAKVLWEGALEDKKEMCK